EGQLAREGVPYEAGIAQYREIARGQIIGDEFGMLKLLIHEETRQILGVHAIGTGATELIHIGQAVIAFQGTVDYFINSVFNYPTLAECYKVAALNGSNKLRPGAASRPVRLATCDAPARSEEHTSELQSPCNLVCRLLLEKKKTKPVHLHHLAKLAPGPERVLVSPRTARHPPLGPVAVLLNAPAVDP